MNGQHAAVVLEQIDLRPEGRGLEPCPVVVGVVPVPEHRVHAPQGDVEQVGERVLESGIVRCPASPRRLSGSNTISVRKLRLSASSEVTNRSISPSAKLLVVAPVELGAVIDVGEALDEELGRSLLYGGRLFRRRRRRGGRRLGREGVATGMASSAQKTMHSQQPLSPSARLTPPDSGVRLCRAGRGAAAPEATARPDRRCQTTTTTGRSPRPPRTRIVLTRVHKSAEQPKNG